MSKFKYYVTSMFSGVVEGTDDDSKAVELSEDKDNFVVDSSTGELLNLKSKL